ncbi:MAG: Hsp70 family protein, partial [Elusimicrobiota bacterium]|nr:Hsp70 family protein [Elusimicrobiota bacterium]
MSVIEIGIDLGTTNSEIAVFNKGKVEIVKNALGDEYTPSVFGINKAGAEEVGKRPYFRCFKDAVKEEFENNKAEIKRLMGTEKKIYFPRAKKEFSPEEISAKILLSLKQDAVRKNEKINAQAAVITYPAYFSTLQAEATKRAGEAAGFKYVVLLQEPIAAAMAYGFKNEQNENILVYDLGGGTFDAALISLRDGNLTALSHNGDNFLGGKDIDNLIVENKIIPVLCGKYNLDGFERKEPKYAPQFAKLKYAAEQAKIQLSQMPSAQIEVDAEIDGENIYESIELSQKDLEEIMENMIARTIELCKKTISDAKIKNSAVDRIIFVGAPTQLPFLKQRLESELSIKADSSSDPFTAIAQGACIFAASQIIPEEFCETKAADKNRYEIKLQYDPLTSEYSQLITGVFEELKDLPKDYFIQIQSEDNKYNSGRIKLKNGKFAIEIALERKKNNNFWIYLFDAEGRQMDIS